MRKFLERRSVRFALGGLAAIAMAFGLTNMLANSTPYTAPPAPIPAPVASESPSSSATPTKALPSAEPGGQAAGDVVEPTSSEADTTANTSLSLYWNAFVTKLKTTKGTKLLAPQLEQPPVVFVTDLSGCPPGTGNKLSNTVKSAAAFCESQIKLVSGKFNALSDNDKRRAAASVFLYHALATTTPTQRSFNYNRPRTDAEMLGCLQASLSYVFGQPESVWVVMRSDMNGGDVYSAYYATIDFDGKWS